MLEAGYFCCTWSVFSCNCTAACLAKIWLKIKECGMLRQKEQKSYLSSKVSAGKMSVKQSQTLILSTIRAILTQPLTVSGDLHRYHINTLGWREQSWAFNASATQERSEEEIVWLLYKKLFPMTPPILFPGRSITPFTLFVSALRILAPSTAVPELFLTQPNSEISFCSQNTGRDATELAA